MIDGLRRLGGGGRKAQVVSVSYAAGMNVTTRACQHMVQCMELACLIGILSLDESESLE